MNKDRRAFSLVKVMLLVVLFLWVSPSPVVAGQVKDSESAAHGFDAASLSIVGTYAFPGFEVIQFDLPVLSVYSYMLISDQKALIVDPVRDVDRYVQTAKEKGAKIEGVYLSHSHADFVAGHMEMLRIAECPVYQSAKSGAQYKIHSLDDGTEFSVGHAKLKFMDTPGHTPDGGCLLAFGNDDSKIPKLMFTGDVLFVGSAGRPDLMGGTTPAAWLASALFDSWTRKISKLDDTVMILPAHGAGSLCGAHLSDEPSSTIGKERVSNPYLQHRTRGAFIASLLEGLPEAPQYFKHNARMNKEGPPLVDWKAPLPLAVTAEKGLTEPKTTYIVDVRTAEEYAKGHIPNAINIGVRGRMETWVGIMIPWKTKLVLCGGENDLRESLLRLHRVGYEPDVITLGAWEKEGLGVTISNPVSPKELRDLMGQTEAPVIVDVRLPNEWMGLRIGTVLNLPLNHLSESASQMDPSQPVVTVCNSAYRSSMAVGILERLGFTQARNLEGGSEAWIAAGYPVLEPAKPPVADAAPVHVATPVSVPKKQVNLPERISASDLKRLLMDLPNTFDLVDVRPPEHFRDYRLPGAVNVDVSDLLENPKYLVGIGPLVIVDRDGSVAMAIGGALSQKTKRVIKVLYNGLQDYWSQTGATMGTGSSPAPLPSATTPPATQQQPVSPAQPPATPKKKSAGC